MKPNEIHTYYQESFNFLQARKKRQAGQLVLLSNLRRGDANISSTLMLTLFDRIMAGVYDDKIQVKFIPSQGINQDQINAYNIMAQSDYQEMGKSKLDYDWCWDTLFFGRGYMETIRFDMKKKIMQPHVINPLNFGYDPYFENVQDWRYYWKWLSKSKYELKKLQKAGTLKAGVNLDHLPVGLDAQLWNYKVMRDQAREGIAPPIQPVGTDVYQILEFYCHDENGDKTVYWIDKNFSTIIYEKKLDLQDGEEVIMPDGKAASLDSKWPIVVKEAFRIPHQSIPISVADLLEDKHRAKSVLLNLAFIAAKDQANPLYGYNPDKVRDVTQFLNRQINQHIPMEDENSAWPLNKASTMSPELMSFIQTMDAEADNPVGTGKPMGANAGGSTQTATVAAMDQQLNDLAQSLQSKVMQFGESEFWSHWFHRYAKNADQLKEKTANIIGVKGVDSTIIDLTTFHAEFPPGVMVYSAKEAEYKDLVKRREYSEQLPILAQTMDADGLKNFYKHVYWPLFLPDPSLIMAMFPETIDEMQAKAENEQLQNGTMPNVSDTDDHAAHIYMHLMVMPKNLETWFHIDWHQKLLAEQKKKEMMAQEQQMNGNMGAPQQGPPGQTGQPQGGQSQVGTPMSQGKEKTNPVAAASPLKSAIGSDNQKQLAG